MTQPWKVRSTSRNSGKQTLLDPNFLDAASATSFLNRLVAKWNEFYHYEVVAPASTDPEGDAAWRELGIDPETTRIARQSRQVAPGATLTPKAAPEAADEPWSPSEAEIAQHDAEVKAIDLREWKRFEGRDLNAKATPEDDDDVFDDGGCRRCSRTGQFITMVLNGQPKGPGGSCFRCNGKGYQTLADVRRNGFRDRHQKVSL